MSTLSVQPAIRSYFLGKGFQDVFNTIKDSGSFNWQTSQEFFANARHAWSGSSMSKFKAVFFFAAACFVLVFGYAFFLVISVWHILLVAVFYAFFLSLFSLVRFTEQVYLWRNKLSNPCPRCHEKFELPIYLCSHCEIPHSRLVPGRYGMFRRRCQCGESLPSTFFLGRSDLSAFCPHCHEALDASEKRPICLPVIGGPSVGKTSFRVASTHYLKSQVANQVGWEISFVNAQTEQVYQNYEQEMLSDRLRQKTGIDQKTPMAFNYLIKNVKNGWERLVYLYDPAGEAFRDTSDMKEHKYYSYLDGLVLMIDPFTLSDMFEYQDQMQQDPNQFQDIAPSDESITNVLERLVITMEQHFGIKRQEKIKQPCAVILNKADAFDLDQKFGLKAAEKALVEHPELKTIEAALDFACKEFIRNQGNEGLLQILEQKFQNYFFFACSTKIDPTLDRLLRPDRPLLWLMSRADRKIGQSLKPTIKTGALNL